MVHILADRGVGFLVEIARAKLMMSSFIEKVIKFVKDSPEGTVDNIPQLPVVLQKLMSSFESAQLYSLVHLTHVGGKNMLLAYLRRPWAVVPDSVRLIDSTAPMMKSLDPFSGLGGKELYNSACTAVLEAYRRCNADPLERWVKMPDNRHRSWVERMSIVIAAISTQISDSGLAVNSQAVNVITDWVREDSNTSKSSASNEANLFVDTVRFYLQKRDQVRFELGFRAGILSNIKTHCLLIAMNLTAGWMHCLLCDPARAKTCFIPSMVDDELAQLMNFVDPATGRVTEVGWYECPNGHRYSVGNCTQPMEVAKCPACGCQIGGRNHTAVAGVKRLGRTTELQMSKPGYMLDATIGINAHDIVRLGKLATIVFRLIIHNVMLMASSIYPSLPKEMRNGRAGAKSTIAELMYPTSAINSLPSHERIRNELDARISFDWTCLVDTLKMEEDDVGMGMHMILNCLFGKESAAR